MSTKVTLFNTFYRLFNQSLNFMGKKNKSAITAFLAERLPPVVGVQTKYGELKFLCPGEIPLWRTRTFHTKEPETLEWIDSFQPSDILWDIGANVGLYSLYAGLAQTNVLAFEPESSNFYLLNKNIELNRLDDFIQSFCIALSDTSQLDYLYISNEQIGSSLHRFSDPSDWEGNNMAENYKQGTLGMSIDNFIEIYAPPFPTHIKIDVDGAEYSILKGARKTLSDHRLSSLMVELDTQDPNGEYDKVFSLIENCNLKFLSKKHSSMFNTSQFASVYNHFFIR